MIELMNHLAQVWWDWMSAMFWQVGLLIVLIAVIDLLIRKWAWPQLRYALWSLVLIKLVLSPTLSLPSGLTPKLKPVVTQMLKSAADKELIEVTWPIVIPSPDDAFRQPVAQSHRSRPALAESSHNDAVYFTETTAQENIEQALSHGLIPDNVTLQSAGPRFGWRVYTMGVWLLGVVTLGLWLFVKLHRLKKEQTAGSGQPSLPESFYNQLDRCAQQLKLRCKPRIVPTRSIRSPAVFGMFQPVLLMPVGYIRRLSRKDTEYMLLHELAHIKRGDLAAHSLCMFLRLVYWYNPLLWIVGRQLRHLRELCCDATVASLLRDKTVEYRQTLLETARRFLATPLEPGLGLVGLFEDSNRLIARIQWLKKPVWRYRKMKNIAVFTAVLILLACVLPMAQAQNPQAENSNVSSEQTEEKSSQSEEASEIEQEQQQTQEQLQAMQVLKFKLQQLQIERQKLQKELQSLMLAQQARGDAAKASLEAKLAKDMVVKASKKAKETKVKAGKLKADAELQKADAEMLKADAEAKRWEQWANSPEVQERISRSANEWAQEWTNSDAFKKWQKEMDKWAKEQAKTHEKVKAGVVLPTPIPNPTPRPMPVMPPMPPLPVKVELETEVDVEIDEVDADVEIVDTPEVVIPVPPVPPTAVPTPPEPPSVPAPTPPALPTVVAPTPTLPAPPTAVAANPSADRTSEVLITEDFQNKDLIKDVLPALAENAGIPIIPDETVKGSITCTLKEVPLEKALQIVLAGTPYKHKKTPYYYLVYRSRDVSGSPTNGPPLTGTPAETIEPAPILPTPSEPRPTTGREVKISKDKDGKFVATTEMHFVSKVKPGIPFIVRNNLGNITMRPSKDGTCDVRAIIKSKAKTAAKAKEMVLQVGMNLQSTEKKYYLKPVKPDGDQWNNLSVDFIITVPAGVKPDIKTDLGNIELHNLKGQIKAKTDLGSLKAVNTSGKIHLFADLGGIKFVAPKDLADGEIELFTKMGDIELIAPRELSARLEAETKMGSIKYNDFQLKVNKMDMFKRKAEGTIGTGQGSIHMQTDMGSIHLKWQSVPEEAPVPKPSPSDAATF